QTGAIYFMMSENDMRAAMRAPFVSFCTDSGARANDGPLAGSKSHPRGWGSYPRILGRYVRAEHLLTLPQAIHKMTALPAARAGLSPISPTSNVQCPMSNVQCPMSKVQRSNVQCPMSNVTQAVQSTSFSLRSCAQRQPER